MSSNEVILRVRNIETFYGPIMAIRGVSLDVTRGSIVTVLGANGAGKSTILRTICGIMDPQKGFIEFEGKKITSQDPAKIVRRGISQVPEGREVFPLLSIADNLKMGSYIRRDNEIEQDMEMCYEYFPILKEREHQMAGNLSGGQQQMLAIARALMSRPKLLLLDEPSLGLSPLLVHEIFEIIKRINKERGVTILLVEQNANVALHTADFGYVLEVGRIVLEGPSADLLENEDVKEFYLGLKDQGVRGKRRWKKRKVWR